MTVAIETFQDGLDRAFDAHAERMQAIYEHYDRELDGIAAKWEARNNLAFLKLRRKWHMKPGLVRWMPNRTIWDKIMHVIFGV